MFSRHARFVGAVMIAAGLAGCADSGSPSPAGRQVQFSLSTKAAAAAPAAAFSIGRAPQIFANGSDTLIIERVQLVLREIELRRVQGSVCDSTNIGSSDCEELELNPILVDLPLDPGATQQFGVSVDTGSYDKLEFQIHKPDGDPEDMALLQAHPEFQGVSIMVTGTFNGTPFTYTTELDVEQEADLVPPLTVTDSTPAMLTMQVDISTWFQNGGALVDPASANKGQPNEGVVKNNIEQSFHAFEDENHDGMDDHS